MPPAAAPLTTTRTICCYCGVGCGITVTRDAHGALQLAGDTEHPVNRGALCSKGRTLLHVVASRADRLRTPQVRLDRSQPAQDTTWDAALAHVAREFARIIAAHGPDAVAVYASGQMLTEEYYVLNKLVKGFLRTNNLDTNSRLCMSSTVAGYKQTLGQDGPPASYADIELCDTFLVTGGNPAWCHPILWQRVEARRKADPGVRIIVVDPRATATVAAADLHLQLIPGTDVQLHYGLGRELIARGAIDAAYIAAHVDGFAAYREACEPWTLAATAAACGLREADLVQAVDWLASDRRFVSMWTMGLNQSSVGVAKNTTLIALSLITGKIGRPGCGPFSLTGQPNAMGGREVGGMANLASNHRDLTKAEDRAEIARAWGVEDIPDQSGLTAVELFTALAAGTVKAVWVIATNPVESLPDAQLVDTALQTAELVVVQDCYPTATTAQAHVILPAATWLEKTGTMTNSERRIALLSPTVPAPGLALPDVEIMCRMAAAMGFGHAFAYPDAAAVFAEHAALSAGRDCDIAGLSHARLRESSRQWPVPSATHPGTPRLYEDGIFPTPSGRARLTAPAVAWRTEVPSQDFPLILTTGRLRDQWHTMTKTGRVQKLTAHVPSPRCEIHPDDAAQRGLKDGMLVEIRTARGHVRAQAEVTSRIRTGTVFLPMHWGRQLGGEHGRTNTVTNPSFDPASKEPDLKFSACEVSTVTIAPRRIIIIGGGAAAWAFLEHHRASGLRDTITIFGEEPLPFYDRVQLPHLVGGSRTWDSLVKGDAAEQPGVSFMPGVTITAIDRAAKTVRDAAGNDHSYELLILATGARPAQTYRGPRPAAGVHVLRRKGDAEAICARAGHSRRAVIVGGGLLGLELADALHHLGTEVTVLQRSARLMARQLDATAGTLLAEALLARGIQIHFGSEVARIAGEASITAVHCTDGREIPADLVVFATGTVANRELAVTAGLPCAGGVRVDNRLQTADPAIFAMGEVADFAGAAAATTAAAERQAWHLVEHLRGNPHAPYPGPVNSNVLKVTGLQLASLGETDPTSPGAEVVVFSDPSAGIYQKAVVRDDRLVGILLWGDTTGFATYRDLIASRTELEAARRTLLRGGAPQAVVGRLVCSCNQVGEDTIRAAIAGGCTTLPALCAKTAAGTGCGSCKSEVAGLLAHAVATAATTGNRSNSDHGLLPDHALPPREIGKSLSHNGSKLVQ